MPTRDPDLYQSPHSYFRDSDNSNTNNNQITKIFAWGCTVPLDPNNNLFPVSATIAHMPPGLCECPGGGADPEDDKNGIRLVILERAAQIHESNVVRYSIPVVNNMAREAAMRIGMNLSSIAGSNSMGREMGVEDLPMYQDRVSWRESDGACVEVLGRGMTPDELEALYELPRGQTICDWIL
ncbi:hypothetical protein F5Y16DRAFT_417856 [Xylariaceae sp. FL0255]|nr:hypothetical protein F5Y16DRAFT_417856 [Xylariaceae sp. FL0255]